MDRKENRDLGFNEHGCDGENITWSKGYELRGLGETLERDGFCEDCKKHIREIWIYSCVLVD